MKALDATPKQDGFHMPGEFEEHEECWMIWPERPDNWRLGAKPAQEQYADVAKAIAAFEPVTVAVSNEQYDNARHHLPENIQVVEIENDDAWIRDTGATIVKKDKEIRGVDWRFNAWGGLVDGLYFPWDKDDALARKMCEILKIDYYRLDKFVLEGGSIHVDGEGTLVVTEECLLSPGRNPELTKEEIEDILIQYLNVEKIIWLKRGIYHDETNGHVDNIFNFVKPGIVVLAWTDDENDPQYEISQECLRILEGATDAKGRKFEIHKMYIPAIPITITKEESLGVDAVDGTLPREEGDRQAASYCNYYTANGGIVFPLFDDVNDAKAEALLKELYPERKIVGVRAREIILGGGNIHCITQQVPKRG